VSVRNCITCRFGCTSADLEPCYSCIGTAKSGTADCFTKWKSNFTTQHIPRNDMSGRRELTHHSDWPDVSWWGQQSLTLVDGSSWVNLRLNEWICIRGPR